MGENLTHFNYGIVGFFGIFFLLVCVAKRKLLYTISFAAYCVYSAILIAYYSGNAGGLFEGIMLHFVVSVAHVFVVAFLLVFEKKPKQVEEKNMDEIVGKWSPSRYWFIYGQSITFFEDFTGIFYCWHVSQKDGFNTEEKIEWKRINQNTIAIRQIDEETDEPFEWDEVIYERVESEFNDSYWVKMWQTNGSEGMKKISEEHFWEVQDAICKTGRLYLVLDLITRKYSQQLLF